MVTAIISTALLEDVSRTLPESPIDLCRAPRCCGYTGATTLRFGRVVVFDSGATSLSSSDVIYIITTYCNNKCANQLEAQKFP